MNFMLYFHIALKDSLSALNVIHSAYVGDYTQKSVPYREVTIRWCTLRRNFIDNCRTETYIEFMIFYIHLVL